ncbi:MAG: RDD family protein [Candidatus Woesearchaeota archaeon]
MDTFKEYNLDLPQEKRMIIDGRIEKRALGFLLDLLLVYIVLLAPLTELFSSPPQGLTNAYSYVTSLSPGLLTIISATTGLVLVLYFSLFEHYLGYTPGMRIVGLQTYTISFPQAVIRNLFLVPILPLSLLFILELYYLIRYKQRFTEYFSNTKTIEVLTYSTTS